MSYRLLFVRRLFLGVGTTEKVAELRSAGTIGAGLTVVLTFTFPEGVNVVFVRMRMVPPKVGSLWIVSLPESREIQSCPLLVSGYFLTDTYSRLKIVEYCGVP